MQAVSQNVWNESCTGYYLIIHAHYWSLLCYKNNLLLPQLFPWNKIDKDMDNYLLKTSITDKNSADLFPS